MKKILDEDTIAAISTPVGPGGIGIIRMSGQRSLPILKKMFRPSSENCPFHSHKLYHGLIIRPDSGRTVDEALCVYMKSPRTYTREDVVEIQCHAGHAVLNQILDLCLALGARLAQPGEFTRRAFLNGRIDLVQAEAVLDLTAAEAKALSQLGIESARGRLSEKINQVRKALVSCLAALEVAIDYPEEDSEILHQAQIEDILRNKIITRLSSLVKAFERTRLHRFGARVILAGKPNAGKSSLLNALSCEDRAIVTGIPGTTRDVIEARIDLDGVCVTLLDTAGVRNDPGRIEEMGIKKIKQLAPESELFLWLIDLSEAFQESDFAVLEMISSFRNVRVILVLNKIDKISQDVSVLSSKILQKIREKEPEIAESPCCFISAKEQTGLSRLQELIRQELLGQERQLPPVAPNLRQRDILKKSLNFSRRALNGINLGISPEIPALDIRQALDCLGEITGETVTEDILEQIFSSFCLGK